MTTLATVLTEGYADWEIGALAGAARIYYGMTVIHTVPGGGPIRSAAGLAITPDSASEQLDLTTIDALIVVGGGIWRSAAAPDISRLLTRARDRDVLIAGICDGTRSLAKAGLLDEVGHTSNSRETLIETGYRGRQLYWDVPHAVIAEGIVTAPGTAPISFMGEVLSALGLGGPNLDFYLGLLAAEHASRVHLPPVPSPAKATAN
jgi:putative intracellular protease/amidase